MAHPFPYKKWTIVNIVATGETGVVAADELDGVVAVKVATADLLLVRHADLSSAAPVRTSESYDQTKVHIGTTAGASTAGVMLPLIRRSVV